MPRHIATPRLLPPTIAVMAMLLVLKSFALVRHALASDAPPTAAAATAAPPAPPQHDAAAAPAAEAAPAPPPVPPMSESERALLLDLRARRDELDAREAALRSREQVIAAAEHRLATRVDELKDLQTRIESLEAERQRQEAANWQGLVKVYEGMKPRDAAAIFNDLDMPVLLEVVDRMKESKAAAILAAMQPERARQLTADLAQKRLHATTPPAAKVPPAG